MTTIKTPAEIAAVTVQDEWQIEGDSGEWLSAVETLEHVLDARDEQTPHDILDTIEKAIAADRAQRDFYELIAEAFDERAENWEDIGDPQSMAIAARQRRAAEYLRNQEADDGWDSFIGPMLDAMEEEYGR